MPVCSALKMHSAASPPVVAVLDSGAGGLAVLQACLVECPSARYIYLADDAGFPWGARSAEGVAERILACVGILRRHEPDVVVLASDTGAAVADDTSQQ